MFIWDLLLALLVALLLAVIFGAAFGRPGPWAADEGPWWVDFLILVGILFLGSWAGGAWVRPVGPAVYGVYWLPFVAVGVVFALLIAALAPPERPRRSGTAAAKPAESSAAAATGVGLTVFFWVFFLLMLLAIISAYAW